MMDVTLNELDGSGIDELRVALDTEHLPTDDLEDPGRRFFRVKRGDETIGFGGYELHGENALLRSIVIDTTARGLGAGRIITNLLVADAKRSGARAAYLLTETSAHFFEHLGFAPLDRAKAPAEILATRQAAALCPSTAALLVLPLEDDRNE